MHSVTVSTKVYAKLDNLEWYLQNTLKLSPAAAHKRMDRIGSFLASFANPADYALCRFEKWRVRGWRCAPFEKDWVFAYESFGGEGVIIMDMASAQSLA